MLTANRKTFSLTLFMMLVTLLSLGLLLSVVQQADAGGVRPPGGPDGMSRPVQFCEANSACEWPPVAAGETPVRGDPGAQ